jgi:hypothetical protein
VWFAQQIGSPKPWQAGLPVLALFAPTTLVLFSARFLHRGWDDRPVVTSDGFVMARGAFRAWMGAYTAEGVVAGVSLASLGIYLLTLPAELAWTGPILVVIGVYAAAVRLLRLALTRGLVALAEDDADRAIHAVGPVLSWRPVSALLVPAARLVRLAAFVNSGDRERALAEARSIPASTQARIWEWALRAPDEPDDAAVALDAISTRRPGNVFLRLIALDVTDVYRGRPVEARAPERRRLAARLGRRAFALSALVDAAGGDSQGFGPSERHAARFAAALWPRLWALANPGDAPQ